MVTREIHQGKRSISICGNHPIGCIAPKVGLYLVADIKRTRVTPLTWVTDQCPLPSLANTAHLRVYFRSPHFCLLTSQTSHTQHHYGTCHDVAFPLDGEPWVLSPNSGDSWKSWAHSRWSVKGTKISHCWGYQKPFLFFFLKVKGKWQLNCQMNLLNPSLVVVTIKLIV